jgi:hypothetical protein
MSAAGRKESSSAHVGRGLLATSALTMILVSSSFASSSSSGSQRAAAAQTPPSACAHVRPSDPAVMSDRPFLGGPQVPVCGSFENDELKVKRGSGHGTQIWAGPGDDYIDDQNAAINEIWGAAGRNTAKIDVCKGTAGRIHDSVHDISRKGLEKVLVKCPADVKPSVSRLSTQRGITFPKSEPDVFCGRAGGKRYMGISDPVMRAVDATPNVDFQTVAFSALLYRRTADGQWAFRSRTIWLWDRTYDEQIDAFPGNYWRKFKGDSRTRWFVWFEPSDAGIYEVRIHYRWYAEHGIKTSNITETVFNHLGPFQNRDRSACDFAGPPLPEGTYSGTTDEQQPVSLKVEPLFSAPPKETAWSLITEFSFSTLVSCSPARPPLTWVVDATHTFYIAINSDGTFSSTHSGPMPGGGGQQNITATYHASGRIDRSGTARGLVALSDLSFVEGGVRYACTGTPHTWSARAGPLAR